MHLNFHNAQKYGLLLHADVPDAGFRSFPSAYQGPSEQQDDQCSSARPSHGAAQGDQTRSEDETVWQIRWTPG